MPSSLKTSPVMEISILGYSISAGLTASRFWDLITLVPICLLIFLLTEKDDYFNPGIVIISTISVLFWLFTFELATKSWIVYILCIFNVMAFFMAISESDRKILIIVKRLLVSFLTALLANSLVFGIINGITVALIFLAIYLTIGITVLLVFGLFKFIIRIPRRSKQFLNWMNE